MNPPKSALSQIWVYIAIVLVKLAEFTDGYLSCIITMKYCTEFLVKLVLFINLILYRIYYHYIKVLINDNKTKIGTKI